MGATVLLALAGLTSLVAQNAQAEPAGVGKATVNSVGNTEAGVGDIGACATAPAVGTCNLRQAIYFVNSGLADTINFHPATFPKAAPGVINLEGGDGCLPPITREVTIEAKTTGVVLDGDGDNDGVGLDCGSDDGIIQVHATSNGFDFAINGKNADGTQNITFREFGFLDDMDAINIDGDDGACPDSSGICSLGTVLIRGVSYIDGDESGEDIYQSEDLLDIDDVSNITSLTVDNNHAIVDDSGVDVDIDTNGESPPDPNAEIQDTHIKITGNNFLSDFDDTGDGDAVKIDISGDLASKVTVQVNENENLTSLGDEGVDIDLLDEDDAGGGGLNVQVNNNDRIQGDPDSGSGDSAVNIDIEADGGDIDSGPVALDVQVNGNGLTDAGDDGVKIDVDVCCDESNSTGTVQVNGNDDVIGGDDGIDIEVDLGCGDGNDSVVEVNENNRVEGETDVGIDVNVDVGDVASGCSNDDQSDENTSLVQVNGNDAIDGGGSEGVEIDNDTGGDEGNGDDNVSTTEVIGNADITGTAEGVEIDSDSGCESCSDADANTTIVKVNENENITGATAEGVNVSADSGVEEFPGDIGGACCGGADNDADDNRTEVEANDNGNITGNGDDGLELDLQSGGSTSGSVRNENEATISGNGSLTGRTSPSGDGLDLEMDVCCDSANTNTANIVGNADITGRNDGGIEVTLCCSFNVVNIIDNGQIRGNGDDGIDINVDDESLSIADGVQPCPQDCGIWSSVTLLTISGNDIFNSEEQGIDIRAGALALSNSPDEVVKSVIRDNRIHDNRDDGIELENSFGLNIVENEIFQNGDDPATDSGVKVTTDCCGFPINLIPGNGNTISMNSIYDNIGPGIDLVGDTDKDGDGEPGVGCNPFPGPVPGNALSPNDCIPFPTITIIAAGDKVGGTTCADCHVELFLADATPADQTGPLNRQHGEGRTFLVRGTADAAGNFSIVLPCGQGAGDITATATDKTKNTSEFSANAPMLGTRSCATDTPTVTNTNTPAPTATQGPPTATFTPVPPAATATSTVPLKDCGDVNDDGLVNSVDAQLILQLTAALIDSLENQGSADVNSSGEVSSVDAALILQKEAGLILQSALVCPA